MKVPRQKETSLPRLGGHSVEQSIIDLGAMLDLEIESLPEKYRAPFVLCALQGRSRREAARELRLPAGTISSRLGRARQLLRKRLAQQGAGPSMNGALLSHARRSNVPPSLLAATVRAAASFGAGQASNGHVSAKAAAFAERALKALLVRKLG